MTSRKWEFESDSGPGLVNLKATNGHTSSRLSCSYAAFVRMLTATYSWIIANLLNK